MGHIFGSSLFILIKELAFMAGFIALLLTSSVRLEDYLESHNPQQEVLSQEVTPARAVDLRESYHPVVASLGIYEAAFGQKVGDYVMLFTGMPVDEYNAIPLAQQMATDLKEISRYGLTPLVIVEPDSSWGLLNFNEFQQGLYEKGIRRYFEILKQEGITEDMLGIWIPFPEPNVPNWNHSESTPQDYGAAVNTYLSEYRKVFPTGQSGILLNSLTYEPNDEEWNTGQFVSLLPYVENIQPGLVDWFGLQGFPWTPRDNQTAVPIHSAEQFLDSSLVIEASQKLGVTHVWFNTGTYSAKYTLSSKDMIVIDSSTRATILASIESETKIFQTQGYSVLINFFAG